MACALPVGWITRPVRSGCVRTLMAELEPPTDSESLPESAAPAALGMLARVPLRMRAAIAGALVIVAGGTLWFAMGGEDADPREIRQKALALLEDRDNLTARNQARRLAEQLQEMQFRDTELPGATEYILGITMFRDAQDMGEVGREQHHRLAARYLQQSRLQAYNEAELFYGLGISLYQVGQLSAAREPLEKAVESYPQGRVDASLRLQEIYLNSKSEELLQDAFELNGRLLRDEQLTADERDEVLRQRAHILMSQGRTAEAMDTLGDLTEESRRQQSTHVFQARVLMTKADRVLNQLLAQPEGSRSTDRFAGRLDAAEGDYKQAAALLKPVADAFGSERTQARRAAFLWSVCQERIGDIQAAKPDDSKRKNYDQAIAAYERTAEKYETSHEGVAANLRAADLLRREERHEEALKAYKRAMQSVRRPEDFSNRWLTLDDFRQIIDRAWQDWIDQHLYDTAIELSKRMVPLFPQIAAWRYTAQSNQSWSEHLQERVEQTPFSQRARLETELRERWRSSGRAHAELAYQLRTSSDYPDVLWTSAEHYRNGEDFDQALRQLIAFIDTRPKQRLPLALVRLGEVLLDLDRISDALKQFERVAADYPSELAAFEARYLTGVAYLELDRLDEAAETWNDILTSGELTPAAKEWQASLLSLGKLLYHRAAVFSGRFEDAEGGNQAELAGNKLDELFAMWGQTTSRLEEFLKRYADDPDALEARYLLAKALQHSADLPRRRLKTAETENARHEFARKMHALLEGAKSEFITLQEQLVESDRTDMLDEFGQRMLRECSFEIAHTYFALERFEEAIVRYGGAANRFPDDAQVLLAYIQMSNCNDRIGKPDEARSMLEQARIIHKGMADDVFHTHLTGMNKQEWSGWIEWARLLSQSDNDERRFGQER